MKFKFSDISNLIKSLNKTQKGKAILFFAFYIIFFIVLAIVARVSGPHEPYLNSEDNNTISLSNYNGSNYAYNYLVTIDNNTYKIAGSKNGNDEEINIDNKSYYKNGLNYYQNKNGEWNYIETPYSFLYIIDNLDDIINDAYYLSNTQYQSGKEVLIYQVSSATISNIVNNEDLDIDEVPNEIIITIDNNRVQNIEFKLDSYCLATDDCKNMKMVLDYKDFDVQEEIINPIN